MTKSHFTPQDLYLFHQPKQIDITTDGKYAVISVEQIDQKSNEKYSNLWLLDLQQQTKICLTRGIYKDSHPCFSPDNTHIAFLSQRTGHSQIHLIRRDGGESWALTKVFGDFAEIHWSKDGKYILSAFREEGKERRLKRENKEHRTMYHTAKKFFFKTERGDFLLETNFQACLFDTENGEKTVLTEGPYDCFSPCFSHTEDEVYFVSNRKPQDQNWDFFGKDVWRVSRAGGEISRVFEWQGDAAHPKFSHDGKLLAFLGMESCDKGFTENADIFVVDLATGTRENVTSSYDRTFLNFSFNDTWGISPAGKLYWSEDNTKIYAMCSDSGNTPVVCVEIVQKQVTKVMSQTGVIVDFALNNNAGAAIVSDPSSPGEILSLQKQDGIFHVSQRLDYDFNPWLQQREFSLPQEILVESPHKDSQIHGWVIPPLGLQKQQKYPGILYVHGGPMAQFCNAIFHEFQYLAAQGYFVLYCNPHGSHGYGRDFCQKLNSNWGTLDIEDQLAFIDEASKIFPELDESSLAVAGGSYGGFMAAWMTSHCERFSTAIAERGVYNMISLCGTSDFNIMFRTYYNDKFPAISTPDLLWEMSPLKHVTKVKAPTLIIHNEKDHRTPMEQAEQYYIALKSVGVETQLVCFPDSDHDMSRAGRTDQRIARLELIRDWLTKHLKK